MKRQRKTYTRPFKRWDKSRIKEESKLVREYGLKNKKELWKAQEIVRKFRARARRLFTEETGREELFSRLSKLGIFGSEATLDDVLGLKIEDILERRLQTLVFRKGLAQTPGQARQLITHRHITINDAIVDIPGHLVDVDEEKNIKYSEKSVLNDPKHPIRSLPKKEDDKEEKGEIKKDSKAEEPVKVETPKEVPKTEVKEIKEKVEEGPKENTQKIEAEIIEETPKADKKADGEVEVEVVNEDEPVQLEEHKEASKEKKEKSLDSETKGSDK